MIIDISLTHIGQGEELLLTKMSIVSYTPLDMSL